MNLEQDANALEARWTSWDVACRPNVADEIAENEMARVEAENSRGGIPLATPEALAQYEETFRRRYDVDRESDARALDQETDLLADQIARAIAEGETLPSEREIHRQSSSGNMLLGTVVEELQRARFRQEWAALTVDGLAAAYAGWTDAGDRTAIRVVEAAVTSGLLEDLGLRPDPERDAVEIPRLKQAVTARRQQRVGPALYVLQARVKGWRTMQRQQTALFLRDRRGIASRPRPTKRRIGSSGSDAA